MAELTQSQKNFLEVLREASDWTPEEYEFMCRYAAADFPAFLDAAAKEAKEQIAQYLAQESDSSQESGVGSERQEQRTIPYRENESVLPSVTLKENMVDIREIIFCSSIAGGARYDRGMPADLVLTRRLADGTELNARYVLDEHNVYSVEEAL